jgi:hypothetical protein
MLATNIWVSISFVLAFGFANLQVTKKARPVMSSSTDEIEKCEQNSPLPQKVTAQEKLDLQLMVRERIGKFLEEGSKKRLGYRATLLVPPFRIYMRLASRFLNGEFQPTIDVASIDNIETPGRGAFSVLLQEIEKIAFAAQKTVYVECVNNESLSMHLARRGYHRRDEELSVSYFKTVEMLRLESQQDNGFFSKNI